MSFSDAMERAVNVYKSSCYFDPKDIKEDIFVCPKCKDNIFYSSGTIIEFQCPDCNTIYYKCPLCGEWF